VNLEPVDLVPIYRSEAKKPCRERALVLQAQGIPHLVMRRPEGFVLFVPPPVEEQARREIEDYEEENRGWPRRYEPPPAAESPGKATVVYALLIVAVFLLQGFDDLGTAWWRAGVSDAGAIRGGELWRAMTSLFLHSDLLHLGTNLFYGAVLGFLVAYVHGGGLGWLAIVLAGFLGNVTNALILSSDHRSIGASTAVFGAVGVLAGAEWLRRTLIRDTKLRILAPLVIGVLLLGYLGMGGAHLDPGSLEVRPANSKTDISAHVTGLFWGLPLGALLSLVPLRFATDRRFQLAMGATALGLVGLAWALAIVTSGS